MHSKTIGTAILLLVSLTVGADASSLLDTYVRGLLDESNVSGINAAVRLRDGRVILASAGFADIENHTLLSSHTRMPGGSTGKTS